MAASIVHKVKDKVRRTTSLHRKKSSKHSLSEAKKSEEYNASANVENAAVVNTSYPISSYRPTENTSRLPHTVPAWHVHRGPVQAAGPVDSAAARSTSHAGTSYSHIHIPNGHPAPVTAAPPMPMNESTAQEVPTRGSSLRAKTRDSPPSVVRPPIFHIDSSTLPGLTRYHQTVQSLESNPRTHQTYTENRGHTDRNLSDLVGQLSLDGRDVTRKPLPDLPTTRKPVPNPASSTPLEINQQHEDEEVPPIPPRDVRRSLSISSDSHSVPNTASPEHEHLRLPEGFDLNNTVQTKVDTQWRPAVTHETIHRDITEIVQEQITRDIHVHHYYVYEQPIKVVEVLPAKHYVLDPVTGEKIEIPPPLGWMMPENLQPRVSDTSMIKATTRHYLVNEEFPNGIPEPPPTDYPQHANEFHVQHFAK